MNLDEYFSQFSHLITVTNFYEHQERVEFTYQQHKFTYSQRGLEIMVSDGEEWLSLSEIHEKFHSLKSDMISDIDLSLLRDEQVMRVVHALITCVIHVHDDLDAIFQKRARQKQELAKKREIFEIDDDYQNTVSIHLEQLSLDQLHRIKKIIDEKF